MRLDREFIKKRMERFGMTQVELAGELGCKKSHISNVLCGRRELGKDYIFKIAEVLDTRPEKIFRKEPLSM